MILAYQALIYSRSDLDFPYTPVLSFTKYSIVIFHLVDGSEGFIVDANDGRQGLMILWRMSTGTSSPYSVRTIPLTAECSPVKKFL